MNHHVDLSAAAAAAAAFTYQQHPNQQQQPHNRSSSVGGNSSTTSSPPSVSPPQLLTSNTNNLNLTSLNFNQPTTNYLLPYYFTTNPTANTAPFTTAYSNTSSNLRCPSQTTLLGTSAFLTSLDPNSTTLKTFADTNFMYQATNKQLSNNLLTSLTNSSTSSLTGNSAPNAATSSLNHPLYLLSNPSKTTSQLAGTSINPSSTSSSRALSSTSLNTSLISCGDPFGRNGYKQTPASILAQASTTFQIPFSSFVVDLKGKRPKKRFKKPPEFRKVLPKNSLMLLHELRPNVEYR